MSENDEKIVYGESELSPASEADKKLINQIKDDFKFAFEFWKKFHKEAETDLLASLGEQWKKEDVETLTARGVKALTINKIKPNMQLLLGMESQNRTDFAVYPTGVEDEAKGEIATRLLKNLMTNCDGDRKISDNFEVALTEGAGFIKPYIDYSRDLINGEMKLKNKNCFGIFVDPSSVEYDCGDAKFIYELITGLSKDELKELYPEKSSEIDNCKDCRVDISEFGATTESTKNYGQDGYRTPDNNGLLDYNKTETCDIVEYHYKKWVETFYVADKESGTLQDFATKDEAEKDIVGRGKTDENGNIIPSSAVIIKRFVPEIWTAVLLGKSTLLQNQRAWSYPNWPNFPLIPQYALKYPAKIPKNKAELQVQGLARSLKDLNFEFNKRRTQELHILNTSANSGWMMEQGSVPDKSAYQQFGSTPGVILEYLPGKSKPEKITPTQLSQGHAQLAAETTQDMKEATGINTDLLAMNESQASGRAIALRQRQGMVMVQKLFDNHSFTKRLLGEFLLSQIGEVYDVESAIRVLGAEFMQSTFGSSKEGIKAGISAITEVLADTKDLKKYDVVVGESMQSDTAKISNYLILMELSEKNIPIPPEILLDQSLLPAATKNKIKTIIEQASAAQGRPGNQPPGANGK